MIAFDPRKDRENVAKHGFSLAAAEAVFDGPYIERVDDRAGYAETRFVALGPIADLRDRLFVVVYTWRGGVRRIISFRKANDREVRSYRDSDPRDA